MKRISNLRSFKISKVEITDQKITGRGGLFFILRYIENTKFYHRYLKLFENIKKSSKGLSIVQFAKQLFAHFIDGTDMSMKSFDRRKDDEAYAAALENTPDQMASSHQMKRFFSKFIVVGNWIFRKILLELFIWRLHIEQPNIIILFGDTMVLDNDDAKVRESVEPTYKKKKGFQPLQLFWGPYLVDALFRAGSVHSNHGSDFMKAVGRLVNAIRNRYKDVPIILLTDSGFMDDQNFRFFEQRLKILYICGGKQYADLKEYVQQLTPQQFTSYSNRQTAWNYVEFGNRLNSWNTFRRCIFSTLETEDDGQMKLEFVKTDTFMYTNIGIDNELTEKLIQAGGQHYVNVEEIIKLRHQCGKAELNHRSIKEFHGKEQLPFKREGMNQAYYYFLGISHLLYEAYKRDVAQDIIPENCYPTTFRRQLVDFAAKIVQTGNRFVLQVSAAIYHNLKIEKIWELSGSPPIALIQI